MHIRPFTLSNATFHCEQRLILFAGGGHHYCLDPLIKYKKGIEKTIEVAYASLVQESFSADKQVKREGRMHTNHPRNTYGCFA